MVHPCIPSVLEIANPIAESLNLEIVHAVFQTNYNPPILRIDIRYRQGHTGLEHCEQMSRALEEALEQQQTMREAYVLEVSSPGIPDVLTTDQEFISFKGFPVLLDVQPPIKGGHQHRGTLLGRDDAQITINQKGRLLKFPRTQVTQVRLVETLDP
ncbi:MAG: ribosome maturation factor RimP [Prochlorotrichaceae cyanobacterium]|jgi:ribosome maturation factor RimP